MRINSRNIQVPSQTLYQFCDGVVHSDPQALTHFFAAQSRPCLRLEASFGRAYEKARRLQRLAKRARKARDLGE